MEEVQPWVVEEGVMGGTQSLVSEDAGLAGDALKAAEVPSEEPAVPNQQVEEESKESENNIEQENEIEKGLGSLSSSEQRSDVEIVEKEPGEVEEKKEDNVEVVKIESENEESVLDMTPLSEARAAEE